MFCPSCGNEISDTAKFCSKCGANLQNTQETTTGNEGGTENRSTQVQDTVKNLKENEYVQQGAEISKQYFQFALSSLKQPFNFAKKVDQQSFVNGLISIILFSIFFPLTTYFFTKNFAWGSVPFGETVITPAIILFITFLVITGIMLAILQLMRVGANFKELIARVGSLFVFPLLFVIVGCLLTIIKASFLGLIFSSFGLVFLQLSYFAVMFSYEKKSKGGLDAYYGIILTIIAIIIVFAIISSIVFESILHELYYFF